MALKSSVSLEEYDQTLRDSVNAYYEHAMNDPSMSKDEAIASTSAMAEEYLNAVDEFQTNMETENVEDISTTMDESSGIDNTDNGGIDSDDGIE